MSLHAFNAADLARINRVVRIVESAPWKRQSPPVAAPLPSDLKLGYNGYASVAPGGSGLFDWRMSTAAGTSEITMGASTILAYDWFGSGLSTGEKVLLFQPRPSARWYFLKPGQGNGGGGVQWAKVVTTATTRVNSGFGSTASLWYGVQPCANSEGDSLDSGTTYVVCIPKGSTSLHFASTGDIVAIAKDSAGLYGALGHTGIRGWMCREGTATLPTGASTFKAFQFTYADVGHTNAADFISATAGCTEITLLRRGLYLFQAAISLYGTASQAAPGGRYNFLMGRKSGSGFFGLPGAVAYCYVENDNSAISHASVHGIYGTTATTDIVAVGAFVNSVSAAHTADCHSLSILHMSSRQA